MRICYCCLVFLLRITTSTDLCRQLLIIARRIVSLRSSCHRWGRHREMPLQTFWYLRRIANAEGIVTLGVTLSRCACVRRISLGGEGNALLSILLWLPPIRGCSNAIFYVTSTLGISCLGLFSGEEFTRMVTQSSSSSSSSLVYIALGMLSFKRLNDV